MGAKKNWQMVGGSQGELRGVNNYVEALLGRIFIISGDHAAETPM